jgi:HlyD family secretion protein
MFRKVLAGVRWVLNLLGRALARLLAGVRAVLGWLMRAIRAVLRVPAFVFRKSVAGVRWIGNLLGRAVGRLLAGVRAAFRWTMRGVRAVLSVPGWFFRKILAGVRWVGYLLGRAVARVVAGVRAVFGLAMRAVWAVVSVPVWMLRKMLAGLRWFARLLGRAVARVVAGIRAVFGLVMRAVWAVLGIPGLVLRKTRAGLAWIAQLPGKWRLQAARRIAAARARASQQLGNGRQQIKQLPARAVAAWQTARAQLGAWRTRIAAACAPVLEPARKAFARLAPPVRQGASAAWGAALSLVGPRGSLEPDLARRMVFGLALIGMLGVSFGVWAATTPIAGAVIASGLVVVEGNIKKVQHPTGGIVGEILVKNGDRVAAGDVVLKLDETQARANLGIIVSQLVQLVGRKARLEAERDQAGAVTFPANFLTGSEDAAAVAEGEMRLFDVRQLSKKGQVAQYRERIGQLHQEIKGLTAQMEAKEVEVALMTEELERVDQMRKKELLPTTRLLTAQRDHTRLKGEWGQLIAQSARAHGQISEIELQIIGLDQTMQTEASKELREIEGRMAELAERRIGAEDQLKRVILRAPLAGVVHELSVHTVGGVIAAGEAVMSIVPDLEALTIEVRIATADIEQVSVGQETSLRFPAFNQRTTPELRGVVSRVAADLSKEAQTNTVFYVARVRLVDEDKDKLKLMPGMPVEVFIATGARTALSYLVKPVSDQLNRAFRER